MLWRALQHVEQGFYIDVGANDPIIESVTKAFSERGWQGINIEPLQSHHVDLERDRPQDINLQCAAGETNGEIEIWEGEVRGWSTASKKVADQYLSQGCSGKFYRVSVCRLADICEKHVKGEIHFLKIDVEGFERAVINGMDFTRFRPWVMVIEATRPNSTEENYSEWEGDVISAGYKIAYCDGLNRFYVAKEHVNLLEAFSYPPNVFDKFIRYEQLSSELRAQQAESTAKEAELRSIKAENEFKLAKSRIQQAGSEARQAEAEARQAELELRKIYSSHSWRITVPLRWLMQQLRLLRAYGIKVRLQVIAEKITYNCKVIVKNFNVPNDVVKHNVIIISNRLGFYPVLRSLYRRFVKANSGNDVTNHFRDVIQPTSFDELPKRAKKIYLELKTSADQQQEIH